MRGTHNPQLFPTNPQEPASMSAITSRRNLLKIMSGAPLLPLSTSLAGAGAMLTGCGGGDSSVTYSVCVRPSHIDR
jgi:hypothetical protein